MFNRIVGRIYFLTTDNDIVNNYEIRKSYFLMTGKFVNEYSFDEIREIAKEMKGIVREVNDSDEIFGLLIKNKRTVSAVQFCYNTNPEIESISDAKKYVDGLICKLENKTD